MSLRSILEELGLPSTPTETTFVIGPPRIASSSTESLGIVTRLGPDFEVTLSHFSKFIVYILRPRMELEGVLVVENTDPLRRITRGSASVKVTLHTDTESVDFKRVSVDLPQLGRGESVSVVFKTDAMAPDKTRARLTWLMMRQGGRLRATIDIVATACGFLFCRQKEFSFSGLFSVEKYILRW